MTEHPINLAQLYKWNSSLYYDRMISHAFRLRAGDDLKKSVEQYIASHSLQAAIVVACVGSLSHAVLRLAGAKNYFNSPDDFEIVSATGTASTAGMHIHLAVSDKDGTTVGGHLAEGCLVRTTCEVVLLESPGHHFEREDDPETGFTELVVKAIGER
ncbi:PPC domain-containing DNA-binding protein [Kribbella sindirgiensis]|uniref:DNA-binding protein n=1 Tax=Kribbella sindirgiensis TaxID=1124744 RepID=A0A4V6N496_9ACTN|nr:PPC domain-containing DNA-binding protein [Kribbella sindirgiensis]TCC39372.1 DNA-binding protein [Kribbella sindirgiensis]